MRPLFVLLLLVVFLSPAFPAEAAEQARVPAKLTPKVDNFLKQLENAKSFNEFKEVIGDARFSQEELAKLREEAKKPAVSEKLKRLLQEEQLSMKSKREERSQALIKKKESEHQERQEVELKQINSRTMVKLQNLKATKPAIIRAARLKSPSTPVSTVQSQMSRPPVSSAGIIRALTPGVVTVGKSLTISGSDFGSRWGRVLIGIERDRVDCSISSWSDREIVITVPEEFQPFVGMEEKVGFVWVKLHGSENGPFRDVTIRPDIEGMTPKITSLSTTELKPGAILLIEGENFYTEPRGKVEFRFGNKIINGQVTEWQDNYIAVNIHGNTQGLARTDGMVVVKNHLNLQTIKAITFVPRLKTITRLHQRQGIALLWVGYKGEHDDFSIQLKNGWTVKENYLECDGINVLKLGHYGCRFVTQAVPGSTHALSRTLIWIDIWGFVYSDNYLIIEGPAGLEPY